MESCGHLEVEALDAMTELDAEEGRGAKACAGAAGWKDLEEVDLDLDLDAGPTGTTAGAWAWEWVRTERPLLLLLWHRRTTR
mmetsp:Transcript_8807/g.26392  ORF Transcript_8807/g.26392 Transcript_8807/m.26392 type:complete len:82 (-) Transcript_8807:76-321(-)